VKEPVAEEVFWRDREKRERERRGPT